MAILNFQKPDKVIMIDSSEHEGKFEFRPLEPGYGLTVGNALRRVLLSSLEGFAITSVKIENVEHEFSTIPGVVEDVTEIILNLKSEISCIYFLNKNVKVQKKTITKLDQISSRFGTHSKISKSNKSPIQQERKRSYTKNKSL